MCGDVCCRKLDGLERSADGIEDETGGGVEDNGGKGMADRRAHMLFGRD